jgi:hypothetical protein
MFVSHVICLSASPQDVSCRWVLRRAAGCGVGTYASQRFAINRTRFERQMSETERAGCLG